MRYSGIFVAGVLAASSAGVAHAQAATWNPTQNVEIIVPAAAGGANDLTGRLVQRVMQDARLVPVSMSVVNKPGGGHSVGLAYLNQRAGDGH